MLSWKNISLFQYSEINFALCTFKGFMYRMYIISSLYLLPPVLLIILED